MRLRRWKTFSPDVDYVDDGDDGDDVDDGDDGDDVLFSVLLRLRRWQTITFLPATLSPLWIQPPSSVNTPNDTPHCFNIHHGKDKQTVSLCSNLYIPCKKIRQKTIQMG